MYEVVGLGGAALPRLSMHRRHVWHAPAPPRPRPGSLDLGEIAGARGRGRPKQGFDWTRRRRCAPIWTAPRCRVPAGRLGRRGIGSERVHLQPWSGRGRTGDDLDGAKVAREMRQRRQERPLVIGDHLRDGMRPPGPRGGRVAGGSESARDGAGGGKRDPAGRTASPRKAQVARLHRRLPNISDGA